MNNKSYGSYPGVGWSTKRPGKHNLGPLNDVISMHSRGFIEPCDSDAYPRVLEFCTFGASLMVL